MRKYIFFTKRKTAKNSNDLRIFQAEIFGEDLAQLSQHFTRLISQALLRLYLENSIFEYSLEIPRFLLSFLSLPRAYVFSWVI